MSFKNHGIDSAHFLKSFQSNSVSTSGVMQPINRRNWIILSKSVPFSFKKRQFITIQGSAMIKHQEISSTTMTSRGSTRCQTLSIIVCTCEGSWLSFQLNWKFSIKNVQLVLRYSQALSPSLRDLNWSVSSHQSLDSVFIRCSPTCGVLKFEFKMKGYFADLVVYSGRTSLFEISKSASELMQTYVLFHKTISLSPWTISDSPQDIISIPVRFSERCLSIMRSTLGMHLVSRQGMALKPHQKPRLVTFIHCGRDADQHISQSTH